MLKIPDCQDTRERSEKHIDGDPNTDFTFSKLRKKSREK
jgi:hypothetical protein